MILFAEGDSTASIITAIFSGIAMIIGSVAAFYAAKAHSKSVESNDKVDIVTEKVIDSNYKVDSIESKVKENSVKTDKVAENVLRIEVATNGMKDALVEASKLEGEARGREAKGEEDRQNKKSRP